jgi:Putative zinc- or iron-chelating domain
MRDAYHARMASGRSLPLYGGTDSGPRPAAREQVRALLDSGADPMLVAERVASNVDALWNHHAATASPGDPRPACARGCSHCCHGRVEATAPEVFLLARHLRARPDAVRDARIARTASSIQGIDRGARHRAQVPCALLDGDGACTVYEARPLACRRAHSTDASICAAVHRDPALDVRIPSAPALQWNASSLVLGWLEGLAHAGRPPHHYELHAALRIALEEHDAEALFLAGGDPLEGARSRAAEDLPEVLGRAARY